MAAFVREVRGIPLWLLRDYLVDAGGLAESDTVVTGDGWRVTLTQLDDYEVGSLRVGQLRVELDGEPDALARMQKVLAQKLLRAGG